MPVDRAIITHAHSDHAAPGSRSYLTARPGESLLRARVGPEAVIQSLPYGEPIAIGDVTRVVPSRRPHPRLGAGPPGARRRSVGGVRRLQTRTRPHLRTLRAAALPHVRHRIDLRAADLPLARRERGDRRHRRLVARQSGGRQGQPAVRAIRSARRSGCWRPSIPPSDRSPLTAPWSDTTQHLSGAGNRAVRCRSSRGLLARTDPRTAIRAQLALDAPLRRRFHRLVSGWMRIRGTRRRRSLDRGFVLSDHADWPGLLRAIDETARRNGLGDARLSRAPGALARGARPRGRWPCEARFEAARRRTREGLRRTVHRARRDHQDQ